MSSKKVYIALNKGAFSFTDPNSLLNLHGDMVKEIGTSLRASFYINRAIRAGHLREVTKEEFDKFQELNKKNVQISAKNSDQEAYIEQLKAQLTKAVDEKDVLDKRNSFLETENETLKAKAAEVVVDDTSIDFDAMSKAEIKEYLADHYELSQEDYDKMESLNKQPLIEFANQIVNNE